MAADPAQPVKGKEKGIWLIELAQYLRGVRVIDDSGHRYRADGYFSPWVTKNESRVMDENNYHVLVGYLREVGTLADDSPLAGWDAVENSIRTLIAQGRLKSVYRWNWYIWSRHSRRITTPSSAANGQRMFSAATMRWSLSGKSRAGTFTRRTRGTLPPARRPTGRRS